ncbi:hypothetical protein [Vibrio sp. TRT 1302]|uniref:hypothetical protein n=1 Tax=Vibrio sp. TRT 1302 TaxID=3418504 RepID=UPI003CF3FC59
MKYRCEELTYLIDNVCFGDKADAMTLIQSLREEILKLGRCCSFGNSSFILIDDMSRSKHKLVGSSGLLGLYSLSNHLRQLVFINEKYEYNYLIIMSSLRFSIYYLDELIFYLRRETI